MTSQMGMEGCWSKQSNAYTNLHVYLGDYNYEQKQYIISDMYYFNDVRNFGSFDVFEDLTQVWKKHGPCLLTTALVEQGLLNADTLSVHQVITNREEWIKGTHNKRIKTKHICVYLGEQKWASGVGNYIRAECLYRAKICPFRTLESLTNEELTLLYQKIMLQMVLSYQHKGLTIKSYWDPSGNKGVCPLQVYNQKVDPFGNEVVKEKSKDKRTMHWCPSIQK